MKRIIAAIMLVSILLTACGQTAATPEPSPQASAPASNATAPASQAPAAAPATPAAPAASGIVSAKDTMIVVIDREPPSLDPLDATSTAKRNVECNIYDTLLCFDENMKPSPWLAESYEQIDELTFKFNLRKGVKFHNGEEMKASDVLFTFIRMWDVVEAKTFYDYLDKDGLAAPDDYTFILKTKEPSAVILSLLCNYATGILSEKAVTEMGVEDHGRSPVGTGAYKVVSWTAGDNITLESNEDYWEGPDNVAYVKNVVIRIITEASSRTIDLESGGVDIVQVLSVEDVERIQESPETQAMLYPTDTLRYFAFNTLNEKLSDKRVRQALTYATDAETVRKVIYGENTSIRAITPVPPGYAGRNEDLVQYEYNVEKAKEMLKELGLDGGFDLEYMYLSNNTNTMMGEILQEMWKEVNVNLILKPMESAALTSALNKGEHEICAAGSGNQLMDSGDGLTRFFHTKSQNSSNDRSNLSVPEIDELLDKIAVESDGDKRNQMVYDAQVLIHEECPLIYICNTITCVGARADVKGFDRQPSGFYKLNSVYFE